MLKPFLASSLQKPWSISTHLQSLFQPVRPRFFSGTLSLPFSTDKARIVIIFGMEKLFTICAKDSGSMSYRHASATLDFQLTETQVNVTKPTEKWSAALLDSRRCSPWRPD
jgi:hypothetical protein